MPFVNGKFYMNPSNGRAVERARGGEAAPGQDRRGQQQSDTHWVTINGRHVLLSETPDGKAQHNQQDQKQQSQPQRKEKRFSGDATYYDLPGAKTASGLRFDPSKMAAAMTADKAKLGQIVTVTYTYTNEQGKIETSEISVVVNDRGPFERNTTGAPVHPLRPDPQGVIDLTPAAFRQLVGTLSKGRVPVTVTVPSE